MVYRIILIFVFLNASLCAQDLLQKIQDKFQETTSFESSFSQSIGIGDNSQKDVLTGKFYFKKENNYRIELSMRNIISDGTSIWNYDMVNDKVVVLLTEDDPLALSLTNYILNYPEFCEIETEGPNTLVLVPDPDELELKRIQVWCNEKYIVNVISITDFNNNEYRFTLDSIEIKDTPDSLYTFTPRKGTKIIDLR